MDRYSYLKMQASFTEVVPCGHHPHANKPTEGSRTGYQMQRSLPVADPDSFLRGIPIGDVVEDE